uniref:DUF1086 domain-containing protein n=2 Tax=Mesocestoides corti TaxID=53468 RepID=A0A5K3FV75_MESCO
MGLGKTVQVVAMLYALLKEDKLPGPFLIVGPLSTTTNWKREFSFWAPEMQVILYTGDRQNRSMINEYCLYLNKSSNIPAFHAMITSYEMVSLERATLCSFHWQTLIVDEAHRLKNKQSRLFRDLSSYNVEFKILLTGTPLQNNLDELVHLLHFLDPIKFNDFHNLNGQWATMTREERMGHLHNILKGHLLRRMKRDVIKDLPKKTETVVPLSLTHLQKRIYKLVLTKNYEQLRTRNLMNTLLHLQKICNHPYLMPAGDEVAPRLSGGIYEPRKLVEASAKLDLVMRMLPRLKEDGHRVLIFSHFIGMLDLIEIALRNEGFSFERIDGSIRGTLRQTAIDRFNAHNATPFVFLLSTRAGCEGINLASADTVILFDSDWNPHRDLQALARAHRIGQSRHVFIYRLIMRDTVEERILQVAHKKLALTKVVIDDDRKGDGSKKMSNLLRLSHSEAHNILKTGLEVLFAGDGDDEEEEGDKAVKQVESGVDQMSSTAGQISQSDHEDTDAPKQQPRPQSIVYDDEALARLLDRTRVVASDESVGAVDEYLSAFNSAHFAECQENLTVNGTDKIATTASQPADKPDVDPNEISQFWDSLLKRRHERLMSQEAQQRRSGVCRSMENCFTDASMVVIEDSDDSDHHGSPSTNGDDAGCGADAEVEFVSLVAGTRSLLFSTSGTRTKPEVVEENGDAYGLVQRRKSCRRPRPTAACLSTFHNVSQVDDEESETRRQRISRRFRRVEDSDNDFCPDTEESSDEVDNVEDVETWMRGSHMGEQGNSSAPTRNQNKGKKRKQLFTTNDDEHLQRALPTLDELQLAELYRQINWRTDSHSIYATWKDFSAQLSEDVVFSEDGKMTVYGFDAHDRQVFLESVMRYGLPPMGILPPPEWLPFSLRSKPPLSLFAYTNLFMRHLYEDPKVLDTETLRWSDGLPTEGVSGIMVLSRIAMIALIRAKVIQFEDYNAVPRRYKKTTDSRFRFAIHEGGLTMLSLVWKQEMAELETRFAQVQTESTSPQTGKHRLFSVILRKWHYRHDFWLLAGIHAHGYAAFMEILADKRFSMVLLGLAERILPPEKADPFVRQKSDADLISEMRESCAFSAEIVAFLVDRLRMLEHALLVEQALASVTLAALGQTSADSTPEPPEALLKKNQELLSVFSSRLTQKGPIKRIDLPSDPEIAEKVKRAVFDLHLLLEDLYADMPGLPAALVCDGVDFAQPRFFTDSALSQPAARQPLAPSHLECHSPPPPEPSPSDPSCGPVPAQPPPTALLSPPAVDTTTVIEISDSD